MIDAGIWGQLPSLINAGVFASGQRACTFGGVCTWPSPGGLVSAGDTVLCSVSYTAPAGSVWQASVAIGFTPGVGTGLGGFHAIDFDDSLDGTTRVGMEPTVGNARKDTSAFTRQTIITPGARTLTFKYFVNTTGIGNDIIWLASCSVEVCSA